MTPSKPRLKGVFLSALVGIGLYLGFAVVGGWSDTVAAVEHIGAGWIMVALGASLANYGLRYLRWQNYLNILGFSPPAGQHFLIYLAGFSMTTVPGKLGEAIRSAFMEPYGVPYRSSLAAFLAERLSDLLAMLCLCLLGITAYAGALPVSLAIAGVVGGGLLVILFPTKLDPIWHRLGGLGEKIRGVLLEAAPLFSARTALYSLGLGVVSWGLEGWAMWAMASQFASLPVTDVVFAYSFGILVGVVSFLPGGIGSTEAAMVGVLASIGLANGQAVALTIVVRMVTLWFAVLIGMGSLFALTRIWSRRTKAA